MSRHKVHDPDGTLRADRLAARLEIIQAANRYMIGVRRRRSLFDSASLLGSRQLHQAVAVARRNLLVSDSTLVRAGFRPARRTVHMARLEQAA